MEVNVVSRVFSPRRLILKASRQILSGDYGRSRTLPRQAYVSDELLAWERERLFDGSWVCIGRSDGLGELGAQRAVPTPRKAFCWSVDEMTHCGSSRTRAGIVAMSCLR